MSEHKWTVADGREGWAGKLPIKRDGVVVALADTDCAAFIARACESFDDLLAACASAVRQEDACPDCYSDPRDCEYGEYHRLGPPHRECPHQCHVDDDWAIKAKVALAKAQP